MKGHGPRYDTGIMSKVTAVSPLTERGLTYDRSVRELGAGNGPLSPFHPVEMEVSSRLREIRCHHMPTTVRIAPAPVRYPDMIAAMKPKERPEKNGCGTSPTTKVATRNADAKAAPRKMNISPTWR